MPMEPQDKLDLIEHSLNELESSLEMLKESCEEIAGYIGNFRKVIDMEK